MGSKAEYTDIIKKNRKDQSTDWNSRYEEDRKLKVLKEKDEFSVGKESAEEQGARSPNTRQSHIKNEQNKNPENARRTLVSPRTPGKVPLTKNCKVPIAKINTRLSLDSSASTSKAMPKQTEGI